MSSSAHNISHCCKIMPFISKFLSKNGFGVHTLSVTQDGELSIELPPEDLVVYKLRHSDSSDMVKYIYSHSMDEPDEVDVCVNASET